MDTTFTPMGSNRKVKAPLNHFVQAHIEQSKDISEGRDHICQQEALIAYDFCLLSDEA